MNIIFESYINYIQSYRIIYKSTEVLCGNNIYYFLKKKHFKKIKKWGFIRFWDKGLSASGVGLCQLVHFVGVFPFVPRVGVCSLRELVFVH